MTDAGPLGADEATFIAVVRSGDTAGSHSSRSATGGAAGALLPDARELRGRPGHDAGDFLRAWKKRESFRGHAALRTWLYRIATNVCLDFLEKRNDRTPVPSELSDSGSECCNLQPVPRRMLPRTAGFGVARETIELASSSAVQHLPAAAAGGVSLR